MQQSDLEYGLRPYESNDSLAEAVRTDPHLFVELLLDVALDKLVKAQRCHQQQKLAEKGFNLGRASAIIDTLHDRMSLYAGNMGSDLMAFYTQLDDWLQQAVVEEKTENLNRAIAAMAKLANEWRQFQEMNACKRSLH